MADPRDTARQWLAERHEAAAQLCESPQAWHAGMVRDPDPAGRITPPCGDCYIDAILSAPGVEVEQVDLALREDGLLHVDLSPPTHAQVVIRLPAEEGTET
jgi:hypothetical protein